MLRRGAAGQQARSDDGQHAVGLPPDLHGGERALWPQVCAGVGTRSVEVSAPRCHAMSWSSA
jgi:hypothetical protein